MTRAQVRLPTQYELRRHEAHALLDAAKLGLPLTRQRIDQALRATGDLSRHWWPSRGNDLTAGHSVEAAA